MTDWGFYGRRVELDQLAAILDRGRFFFAKITGRRRIGKTTLIQQALERNGSRQVLYVQVPDSGPAGVLSAALDAMETFDIDPEQYPRPHPGGARRHGSSAGPRRIRRRAGRVPVFQS